MFKALLYNIMHVQWNTCMCTYTLLPDYIYEANVNMLTCIIQLAADSEGKSLDELLASDPIFSTTLCN